MKQKSNSPVILPSQEGMVSPLFPKTRPLIKWSRLVVLRRDTSCKGCGFENQQKTKAETVYHPPVVEGQ